MARPDNQPALPGAAVTIIHPPSGPHYAIVPNTSEEGRAETRRLTLKTVWKWRN